MKPLQLSDPLYGGPFNGCTVEQAIEANPECVQSLVNKGELALAVGAARYLRETLEEWEEFKTFYTSGFGPH